MSVYTATDKAEVTARLIAYNVRRLRVNRKMSVIVLSQKTGIARRTIEDIQSGKRAVTFHALLLIAEVLGCDVMGFLWMPPGGVPEILPDLRVGNKTGHLHG